MSGLIPAAAWLKSLSPQERGASGDGVNDDTVAMQAAIDACAAKGLPFFTDGKTYSITQLVIPSGLVWYAANTKLVQRANANRAALVNKTPSFGARTDKGIRILGRLFVDCNGANQSDTEASGLLTVGVRFAGVDALHLDVHVSNARRYAIFLVNCRNVTGDPTIVHNPAIPSFNKDGFHVNGNSSDIRLGVLTVENGEDDALALNANDVDHGGGWTAANLSGPIQNVSVGQLVLRNCRQGVRTLSGNQPVTNVDIGSVTGDVSVYAFNAQDYGLGVSSWYKNIRIGSISVDFKDNPGASTLGLVNIVTNNPNAAELSDFWIGNIDRGQVGAVGAARDTIQATLKRTVVKIGRIIERYCSNTASVKLSGGGTAAELWIDELEKGSSAQSGGNWGCAVQLAAVPALDVLRIRSVNCDYLRNLVVATSSVVEEMHIGKWPVTTGSTPLYFNGTSNIKKLFIQEPNATSLAGGSRYTLVDTATVGATWPPVRNGVTANRPTNPGPGDMYYDVSLGRPIWWNSVSGKWAFQDGSQA